MGVGRRCVEVVLQFEVDEAAEALVGGGVGISGVDQDLQFPVLEPHTQTTSSGH